MVSLAPRRSDSFDTDHALISPRVFEEYTRNVNQLYASMSPFKTLVAVAVPNFTKATQTTAHNQTLVNEAQIVCALERYRLTHGNYPETLDALVPQFIEKLPHDIIGEPLITPLQDRLELGGMANSCSIPLAGMKRMMADKSC